jgi:LmbE family N-acetylglucosaminyl deacetylase
MKKTVVAFAAHHDDIEFRAGGTVARLVESGYEVIYVVAVDSVYVGPDYLKENAGWLTNEGILEVREDECRKGAEILGTSEPVFLHLKPSYYWTNQTQTRLRPNFNRDEKNITDGMEKYKGKYLCLESASQKKCVDEIMDFIDSFNPEIVLTQNVNDLHLEHYSIASLAFAACQRLVLERDRKLSLYGWEMGSRGRIIPFVADRIIDISDTFHIKLKSIRPFISQVGAANMEEHLLKMETSCRFWGEKIGVKYAEPFVKYLIDTSTTGFDQTFEIYDYSSRIAQDMTTEL